MARPQGHKLRELPCRTKAEYNRSRVTEQAQNEKAADVNYTKPVFVVFEFNGLSNACLLPTRLVNSFTVPYSVNIGGQYFFFGYLGGMDGFVSLGSEFGIGSPWMLVGISSGVGHKKTFARV
jgi:hypothetical protein